MEKMEKKNTSIFRLPCGYAGKRDRWEVELIPLTGYAEEGLANCEKEEADTRVDLVLQRCLKRVGTIEPVTTETVAKLGAQNRLFLLLKVLELTFVDRPDSQPGHRVGHRVEGITRCPGPDCEERVDVDFSTGEIQYLEPLSAEHGEWDLQVQCPVCRREFGLIFNLPRYFFSQLRTGLDVLYKQVHFLAFHYHWNEREIMALSREKRHRYIDILCTELERMSADGDIPAGVSGFEHAQRVFMPSQAYEAAPEPARTPDSASARTPDLTSARTPGMWRRVCRSLLRKN